MVTVTTTAFDNIPANLDMTSPITYTTSSSTTNVSCSGTTTIDNGTYYLIFMNGMHHNTVGGYTYTRMLLDGVQEFEVSTYGYSSNNGYGMGLTKERQNTSGSAQSMTFEIRVSAGFGWVSSNWTLVRATEPIRSNAMALICPQGQVNSMNYKMNIEDYYFLATGNLFWSNSTSNDYFTQSYSTSGYWFGYTGIMDGVVSVAKATSNTGYEVTDIEQVRMPSATRNSVVTTGFAGFGVSEIPDSANQTAFQLTANIIWAKGTKISVT